MLEPVDSYQPSATMWVTKGENANGLGKEGQALLPKNAGSYRIMQQNKESCHFHVQIRKKILKSY